MDNNRHYLLCDRCYYFGVTPTEKDPRDTHLYINPDCTIHNFEHDQYKMIVKPESAPVYKDEQIRKKYFRPAFLDDEVFKKRHYAPGKPG